MAAEKHAPLSRVFALPLRLGRGTDNEAPIFDRNGELRAECVDDDCVERATALIRAANCHDDMLEALIAAKQEMWLVARHQWTMADFKNWGVIQQIDAALEKADGKPRTEDAIAKAEGRS